MAPEILLATGCPGQSLGLRDDAIFGLLNLKSEVTILYSSHNPSGTSDKSIGWGVILAQPPNNNTKLTTFNFLNILSPPLATITTQYFQYFTVLITVNQ
jgi:hypothetical protein